MISVASDRWMYDAVQRIELKKKCLTVGGFRFFRRDPSIIDWRQQVRSFRRLFIYIHTALADREQELTQFLSQVDSRVGNSNHQPGRYLIFFGGDNQELQGRRPITAPGWINELRWRESMRGFLPDTALPGPLILTRLRPNNLYTPEPDHQDLVLFFCRGREVFVPDEAVQLRFRRIKDHSFWFFFDDIESPVCPEKPFFPEILTASPQALL